ncbi:hypothetical protein [Nocardia sp. NPDC052112]|uniref:hypothetical protein n=1 Tax=Nocardia sp. NPDC052112 TaxID=3155646 RepID=UPI0034263356
MEPERQSPYWHEIVQKNWPAIPPGDWSALETRARDGAAALDLDSLDRARRGFEDSARSSVGMQSIKDDMRAQQWHPRAFADALTAAADVFGGFAERVRRTRNHILDIVDRADRRIAAVPKAVASDDEDLAAAEARRQRRISDIVAEARKEVEDVVRTVLQTLNPTELASLAKIADELGQPGPWEVGPSGDRDTPSRHGPDAHHPHGRHPDSRHPGDARHPGVQRPDEPLPGLPPPLDDELDPGRTAPYPAGSNPLGNEPEQMPDGRPVSEPNVQTPTNSGYGPASVGSPDDVAAVNYSPSTAPGAGPGTSTAGSSHPMSPAAASGDAVGDGSASDASAHAAGDPAAAGIRSTQSGADQAAPDAQTSFTPPLLAGGAMPPPVAASGSTVTGSAPTGSTVSAPASQTRQPVSMSDSRGAVADARGAVVDARSPASDQRSAAAGPPKVAVPSGNSTGVGAPPTKQPLPQRNTEHEAARPASGRADSEGSDELIRDAVGAAMLSAAAPTFVLGERVDGDLVLARTILGGVLTAVGSSAVGLSWAVSVLRHTGGVSAFVTSNEGRGWIPAGLFLPREISTPWLWSESDGTAWEGLADPGRVLVEFGLAWGRKSGARLSALASSQQVDPEMRRQLGDVPMAGEVTASTGMNLGSPGAGLVDRLGLVAAPQLVERVSGLPAAQIGPRCVELAADAHVRLGKTQVGAAASLGAPQLRERILMAIRRGTEVAAQWWDELRDVDDLLAASMLALRTDVSRVALGELRSEHVDGRSATDAATLRSMVFQRRCNELVLLLAEESTRQCLRDAVYAHGQLVEHPHFVQTPTGAAGPDPARRPTISAGPPAL